jgi:hypothetical protein
MLDKVVYLPMPITVDEKREWNAKGYAVLDEVYKPAEETEPVEPEPEPEPQPKRGK